MQEHIFDPLGMSSCGFGGVDPTGNIEQPWGHNSDGTPSRSNNPPSLGPAGSVICSLEGWSKFIAMHLSAARGTPRLLSAESIQKMHDPSSDSNYALGWSVRGPWSWSGGTYLSHDGSNVRSSAAVRLVPGKNQAMLVVINQSDNSSTPARDEALLAMIASFF